jgi:hypothetical protein
MNRENSFMHIDDSRREEFPSWLNVVQCYEEREQET